MLISLMALHCYSVYKQWDCCITCAYLIHMVMGGNIYLFSLKHIKEYITFYVRVDEGGKVMLDIIS